MPATFDGPNLTITLESGVTEVDVKEDIYEPWKDWVRSGYAEYPQAFTVVGGDPLTSVINAGSYFFLNNSAGWRIRPPEEDITIYLTGNLAVLDVAFPAFTPTVGAYTAAIVGLQPVTQGVDLGGAIPSAAQVAAAVWGALGEGSYTYEDLFKLVSAALAGKLSGAGTTEVTIRDINDAKDRITATVDQSGNRTAVILDVSG